MAHKHIGQIANTGRRCVVVFREIYDDKGNVIDDKHCLVFETDTLPDAEHQDLMKIIESEPAQSASELYNVLARTRLGSGIIALNWLVSSQRLRKFPTNNVMLTPDSNTVIGLDKINKIVKMQQSGASQQDIETVLQDDTDLPPRQINQVVNDVDDSVVVPDTATPETGGEGVLDDAAIATNYIAQAESFEAQAKELREQAIVLDPSLAPKPKPKAKRQPRKTTQNTPANNKA